MRLSAATERRIEDGMDCIAVERDCCRECDEAAERGADAERKLVNARRRLREVQNEVAIALDDCEVERLAIARVRRRLHKHSESVADRLRSFTRLPRLSTAIAPVMNGA